MKKYLEAGQQPAKEHMYRTIFNHKYNIEFHQPKKDRCDTCEVFKMNRNPSEEEAIMNAAHLTSKGPEKKGPKTDFTKLPVLFALTCKMCFHYQRAMSQIFY